MPKIVGIPKKTKKKFISKNKIKKKSKKKYTKKNLVKLTLQSKKLKDKEITYYLSNSKEKKMYFSKNNLKIITANCGGQSYTDINGNKNYLCPERGSFNLDNYGIQSIESPNLSIKKKPGFLEKLHADIYCLQEYIFNGKKGIATLIDNMVYFSVDRQQYTNDYYIRNMNNGEIKSINIINLHGKIISPSSSYSQIENAVKYLEELVNTNYNIILGDFNFELMNKRFIKDCEWNMRDYSIRGKFSEKQKKINNNIYNFIERLQKVIFNIKKLYWIYPNKKGDYTNAWCIGMPKLNVSKKNESNYYPSVDFCLVSNNIEGIDNIEYIIHDEFLTSSLNYSPKFMQNDFDHTPIEFKIICDNSHEFIHKTQLSLESDSNFDSNSEIN